MVEFLNFIRQLKDVSFLLFQFLGKPFDGFLMLVIEFVGILFVLGQYFL